jgi:Sulfotransferase domain
MRTEVDSPAEERADDGRRPNLIIAGVTKAGTTSLFNYLGQHPDIGTSDLKEVRYFMPLRYGEPLAPLSTYTRHFRSCLTERFAMEATPGYFYGGAALARGILETCPDVRVVVSLRSPPERCWSWYSFVKSRVRIPKDMTFETYLDVCEELRRAGTDGQVVNQPFWGIGGGCYAEWYDAWADLFGDRLRVVFFEDLRRDPREVVTSLCRWLGLDLAPVDGFMFPVENKTEQYRSKGLQRAALELNRRSEIFFRRHATLKRALRAAYYTANRPPERDRMSAEARTRLDAFYAPLNEELALRLARRGLSLPPSWVGPQPS